MNFDIKKVKIIVFIPEEKVSELRDAVCNAGAGALEKYSYCTSCAKVNGTYIPNENAKPYEGTQNTLEFVEEINKYGGNMPDAIGIPEDMLREAAKMAVCKINVDSDIRIAMTAAIRKHFVEKPGNFDPRKYLAPARDLIEEVVSHKIETVLGCADKA